MLERIGLLCVLLGGCGVREHTHTADEIEGLPQGTLNGSGWNTSAPAAPFEVGPLQAAIFATDPGNDGHRATGLLFLSDADVPCEDLVQFFGIYSVQDLIKDGSGFIFQLERSVDESRAQAPPSFEGLYMGGYGYGASYDQYGMYGGVFHDGVLWSSYYSSMAWVRIDAADDTQVSGEFFVNFWAGEFQATHCGDWEGRSDSGYGSYSTTY